MVSNKLIGAAFAVLASLGNASPCKPSSTKAITVLTSETTTADFTSNTGTTFSISSETSTSDGEKETNTGTTTDATSSTEVSTSASEGATTTTIAEGPLLSNAGFDDGTTAPWEIITTHDDTLVLGRAFQGSASGKIEFGIEDGRQYYNSIGRTVVDYFSDDGDGCSIVITACAKGSLGSYAFIPGSIIRESAEKSVGNWHQTVTTCKFTQEMLAENADISVVFGFKCANAAVYLDSVEFKPIEGTDTTTVSNSETTTITTTTETTTMAATTEGSATIADTVTTTTTADTGPTPLLVNANFDLGTTEPWLSSDGFTDSVGLGSPNPYQGPAYGTLQFTDDRGESYNNYIYQKVDTQLLMASSYHLTGFVRVDLASQDISSDGCNSMGVLCTLGDPNNLNRVPGSVQSVSADSAEGEWAVLETTCTFTEQML
ncbi:hypothetical protein FAUST_11760 [Fusarium austroamericanum]|uniref:Uncharacterized protein n=1 Tax=Fusarium austroamericanum TaxID=282268 RepID=A0AAN5YYC8_FUSAU|nr:hypothetical protein FAUST_11760 [Fusarium austroamericanum]